MQNVEHFLFSLNTLRSYKLRIDWNRNHNHTYICVRMCVCKQILELKDPCQMLIISCHAPDMSLEKYSAFFVPESSSCCVNFSIRIKRTWFMICLIKLNLSMKMFNNSWHYTNPYKFHWLMRLTNRNRDVTVIQGAVIIVTPACDNGHYGYLTPSLREPSHGVIT